MTYETFLLNANAIICGITATRLLTFRRGRSPHNRLMGWLASIADGPGNGYTGGGGTMQTVPAGCVVIGGTNNHTSNLAGLGFFYRPLMMAVNGQWVTIGQD